MKSIMHLIAKSPKQRIGVITLYTVLLPLLLRDLLFEKEIIAEK